MNRDEMDADYNRRANSCLLQKPIAISRGILSVCIDDAAWISRILENSENTEALTTLCNLKRNNPYCGQFKEHKSETVIYS